VPLESVKTSFQRLEQRLNHFSVMPVTFQSFDNSRGKVDASGCGRIICPC
jgi:hypothetical protein